ncbi:hypothetical protein ID866_6050 [Astraeus odoratus]|nr:hypothetical protein ID866_6050 [Astraeus odoratus]
MDGPEEEEEAFSEVTNTATLHATNSSYVQRRKQPRTKRRKANSGKPIVAGRVTRATASLSELLDAFQYGVHIGAISDSGNGNDDSFESVIEILLPDFMQARHDSWGGLCDIGESGELVRPLSRFETTAILDYAKEKNKEMPSVEHIIMRKLELLRQRRKVNVRDPLETPSNNASLSPMEIPPASTAPLEVLDNLRAIQMTHYENSFASRLYGSKPLKTPGLIGIDWESHTPWMDLMDDIHEHYSISHPGRDQAKRQRTPITYMSLRPSHLLQVHDLLTRAFWEGIDVSDSLKYSPERCTVIAMYGYLVVGAAFLSSPQETYITYLVVRAGWDNSHIATKMLYNLISLNPHRDITLHVSANNPAMLLYNRFGFKAEEFIAGFYEDYLHSQSRASMNAFRLRLRR